jgi:predicted SnoaL-like aldol condensation-catalyzing enzyme
MRILPAIRIALAACAGFAASVAIALAAESTDRLEANKAAVQAFYDLAFNGKDPQGAVDRYVGDEYRQHNPFAGDGPQAFIDFVTAYTTEHPELRVEFKRCIAEGDLVVVHCNIKLKPEERGDAVMDIFRLADGKIVEHWDVVQPVPEQSANDNTMF